MSANHQPDRPVLFWFRDDLRLADNPALHAAVATGRPVLLTYILDEESDGVRPLGGAARWWLDKSLRSLSDRIKAKGGHLILRRGDAKTQIETLMRESGAEAVYWSRRYGPARETDAKIKTALKKQGVEAHSCPGALLVEPFDIKTGSGGDYKVFTPFWRALQQVYSTPQPAPEPRRLHPAAAVPSDDLSSWSLHPSKPDWSSGLADAWEPGELPARKRLRDFLGSIRGYATERDLPDHDSTSRLSPHLRFGEISPHQIWRAAIAAEDSGDAPSRDIQKFLSELAWRDFSWHLLFHDPKMGRLSWRREFEHVDWRKGTAKELKAWRTGRTGFPIVDAGMRQLWATGFMHNRVRMIVASFLTKDLLVHWRQGEAWFWDTLVDADEANNANGWQWTAGSGADAAPYFRVFNPTLQGEKFDPKGDYVRTWVPELGDLPAKTIHDPDPRPDAYPVPIVDHGAARERALAAYARIKEAS